ncbi:MAG: biotin--[acetyl-CoA-carboxylase] ligase [Thermoplasmata archaeon]
MGPREFFESIASTQDRAIELARRTSPEGTRVVARSQTSGRGRLDHRWWSPPGGGVYLSLVVDAPPPPRTLLALAIGVELRAELLQRYRFETAIKWPNDLLVTGAGTSRKISGILIDEVRSDTGALREVVGIGMNVVPSSVQVPEELRGRVAAIGDRVDPPPTLEEVEAWVVDGALRAAHALAGPAGPARAVERCSAVLYGLGRTARVEGVVGQIEGIGTEGELWLRHGPDRIAIRAGDVEVDGAP